MDNRGSMLCFSTSHEKIHKFQLIVYHKWCQYSGFGATCSARSCNGVKTGKKYHINFVVFQHQKYFTFLLSTGSHILRCKWRNAV